MNRLNVRDLVAALRECPPPAHRDQLCKVALLPLTRSGPYDTAFSATDTMPVITLQAVEFRRNNQRWLEWEIVEA